MNKKRETVIILLSGGLDSSTALFWAKSKGYDIITLSLNYYLRPRREKHACTVLCNMVGAQNVMINAPFIKEIDDLRDDDLPLTYLQGAPSGYIPNKNLLFYSIAGYYSELLGVKKLIGGQIKSDGALYPDASLDFFKKIEKMINNGCYSHGGNKGNLNLLLPLITMEKDEVLKLGLKLGLPLEYTWSCYEDDDVPCGKCKGCKERASAFEKLDLEDPLLKTPMQEIPLHFGD